MNPAWAWVFVGGVLETVWASGMKLSDGFSNIPWTIFTMVFIVLSTLCLNKGLKSDLPMGICYAVWVGIGAVGSIIVGLLFFGDTLNILGWAFLAVIIVGIVGLNIVGESDGEEQDADARD